MGVSGRAAPPFGRTVVAIVHSLIRDFGGSYRPERHYMRGPGPKWREKHVTPTSAILARPVAPQLATASG
jgi:hypothetical protein